METIKKKVLDTIREYSMVLPGDKVVVGVSGGPDSTALLCLLYDLRDILGCNLHIAHLDHALRGEESKADAEYVLEISRKLNLPITLETIDVRKMIKPKESLESGARRIRYDFYERALASVKGQRIAQGHTADDQAETILMRLLRGSGVQGLCGIPPIREGKYIRPLIKVSRKEVEGYLHFMNLIPRIDASNLSTEYERNKIRLELIPLLENEFKASIKNVLQKTGEILRAEDEFLTILTKNSVDRCVSFLNSQQAIIHIPDFQEFHPALQRRILRFIINKIARNLMGFDYQHIIDLQNLALYQSTGKKINLPQNLIAEKEYDRLKIGREVRARILKKSFDYIVNLPSETVIPELSLSINLSEPEKVSKNFTSIMENELQANLDYDMIKGKLHLRNKRPGDRFKPLGMSGTKKLQDFLVDEKVPREIRDNIPILTDELKILWVIGYRIDDRAKITEKTKTKISAIVQRI
ncbi:tRNA lysidine(34) synthetase TilS [Candidatus Poribacteria bacterium]|nr:tRNA lysidine(34) synthetase TilS [Candidatus Poribacteria bacterium]